MQNTFNHSQSTLKLGLFFALLAAVTYGLNPVLAKLGYLTGLGSIEILHGRFLFATIILAIIGPWLEKDFYKFSKDLIKRALFIALLVLLPLNLLYVFALKDIPASMMSLITYVYPLLVLLINLLVFRKTILGRQWLSVALIILGCVCIFSDALSMNVSVTALALGFLSTLMYALYLISLQQLAKNLSALQITFVTIAMVAISLCFIHNPMILVDYTLPQIGVVASYGLISTVMSTIFLSRAIQLMGATEAGIFCSFEPAFTIGFAALFLGEHIPAFRLAGLTLLILAILLPNFKELANIFNYTSRK